MMCMSGAARSFLPCALIVIAFLFLPVVARAVTYLCPEANAQCTPQATNQTPCTCVVAGFVIFGTCDSPKVCHAKTFITMSGTEQSLANASFEVTSAMATNASTVGQGFLGQIGTFMSSNPLLSGLAMGAGMSLLQSLMSPSGSGSGGSGSDPGGLNSSYCVSGNYYYSQNPPPNDPCALPATSGDTNIHDNDGIDGIDLDFDDDDDEPAGERGESCGSKYCPVDHYCSAIADDSCIPNGKVDCGIYFCPFGTSCTEDGKCSSSDNAEITINVDAESNGTSSNQNIIPIPPGGLRGDLRTFGGGATIIAGSRSGGTDVTGFIGGSGAVGLCQSRPWAKNFLSYIIPPAFFDNLCTWAGYPVGQIQASTGYGSGSTDTSRTVTGPNAPGTTPSVAPVNMYPEAKIRASPPSVNLGGRTTIFWTSRDVSSCEEWSSDGNFSGSTTSGGASTVALAGPVTFYMRCLGVDGIYITSSVTVNIGI